MKNKGLITTIPFEQRNAVCRGLSVSQPNFLLVCLFFQTKKEIYNRVGKDRLITYGKMNKKLAYNNKGLLIELTMAKK